MVMPMAKSGRYVPINMDLLLEETGVSQGAVIRSLEWLMSRSTFRRIKRDGLIKREFIKPLYLAICEAASGIPATPYNARVSNKDGQIVGPYITDEEERKSNIARMLASDSTVETAIKNESGIIGMLFDHNTELCRLNRYKH
jgi:hypothetical protein